VGEGVISATMISAVLLDLDGLLANTEWEV